jgi:hypothetical protein
MDNGSDDDASHPLPTLATIILVASEGYHHTAVPVEYW